ncbi:MAG TPA: hypothetical protein ENJ19_00500 [Gammaproteobacteria bacterium]|nr:hypothetical protein [Gammaproteobacteria bacterium]
MGIVLPFHLLAATVWVGGMFFAYMVLRPVAAAGLEPPERLRLWVGVFGRFFPWVWGAVILLPLSGYLMLFSLFGGFTGAPPYVHLMHGLGLVMVTIYLLVYFSPYRQLCQAVAQENWQAGGRHLARIRRWVGINLIIGIAVISIGGGRLFP